MAALLILGLCVAGAAVGAITSLGSGRGPRSTASSAPPTLLSPTLGTRGLAFMGVRTLHRTVAPRFSLTDQDGERVSLGSLRGRAVVLTFLDDECGWLCPVLPDELEDAESDLRAGARNVDFVAVNVDSGRDVPADLAVFSTTFGLAAIPRWYFLTGPVPSLRAVWRSYGVTVDEGPDGAIVYTGAIYFITARGREMFVATPYADQKSNGSGTLPKRVIAHWGTGIAELAERTLKSGTP